MTNLRIPHIDPDQPDFCEIRIKGQLGTEWTEWFDGLTVKPEEDGTTLVTGSVADQSALHGLFRKLRDLGSTLISVNCYQSGRNSRPEDQK